MGASRRDQGTRFFVLRVPTQKLGVPRYTCFQKSTRQVHLKKLCTLFDSFKYNPGAHVPSPNAKKDTKTSKNKLGSFKCARRGQYFF